jgi:hypothetical protein
MFEINGFDTAGVVSLKRLSLAAALKKARELVEDGCWDVQIVDPTSLPDGTNRRSTPARRAVANRPIWEHALSRR